MQEKLFLIGIGLMFLGIFLTVIAAFISGTGKVEGGVVGFIGPFPILGFATSKRMLYFLLIISLLFFVSFLILGRKFV